MVEDAPRGLAEDAAEPRFLVIGRIIKPHGVRGEVNVEVHTDFPERFTWLEYVYIGLKDPKRIKVEMARLHQSMVLMKFGGFDDRISVKPLLFEWLQVLEEEAIALEEGEYFLYQVIGFKVIDEAGQIIGEVSEILETKANNVFIVNGQFGEVLLPDIDEVIKEVDLEKGTILVHLLPGLIG